MSERDICECGLPEGEQGDTEAGFCWREWSATGTEECYRRIITRLRSELTVRDERIGKLEADPVIAGRIAVMELADDDISKGTKL